jgi:hypothetical protein
MKRFSANQREMDAYSLRERGEEQKRPMTLIRTTADKDHAIAPKVSRRLAQGWEEFVYSERIRKGIYGKMPSLTGVECRCGKGRMTFPHWPPTSRNESSALLDNCLKTDNTHRRYLAYCWWVFAHSMATMTDWPSRSNQEPYTKLANSIRSNCPEVTRELKTDRRIARRHVDWTCERTCHVYLAKRDGCTCFCGRHREECPTHQY